MPLEVIKTGLTYTTGLTVNEDTRTAFYVDGPVGARNLYSTPLSGGAAVNLYSLVAAGGLDIDPRPGGKVYICHHNASAVASISQDGTGYATLTSGTNVPGCAVDWINERIFYSDRALGQIRKVNMDGSGDTLVYSDTAGQPIELAIDPYAGYLFLTRINYDIARLTTAGTGYTTIATGIDSRDMAVDPVQQQLYVGDQNGPSMLRFEYDGSDQTTIFSLDAVPWGIAHANHWLTFSSDDGPGGADGRIYRGGLEVPNRHIRDSGHFYVFYTGVDFDQDPSTEHDSGNAFSNGTLVQPLEGTVFPTKEMIENTSQSDIQNNPAAQAGLKSGSVEFTVPWVGGSAELALTENPSGGPYNDLMDNALGKAVTSVSGSEAEAEDVASGASGTAFDLTDAAGANITDHIIASVEDDPAGTPTSEVRLITDVSTDTVTVHRALGFTPDTGDILRPLQTWAPHQRPQMDATDGHPSLHAKAFVRSDDYNDGLLNEFSGVGTTVAFTNLGVGQRPTLQFSGQANNWVYRTAVTPDITSLISTTKAPIVVNCKAYLGATTLTSVRDLAVNPGVEIAVDESCSGLQGRAGWTWFANGDPTITFMTKYDETLWDTLDDETLQSLEVLVGTNSESGTADYNYHAFIMPAAQLTSVEKAENGGLTYMALTFMGKRPTTSGQEHLYPIYIGTAGKS